MAKQTVLTQEYFDKGLKNLRSGMTKDLKAHVTKEIVELARMTANGFHAVDENFKRVDEEFQKVHLKLNQVISVTNNHERRIKRVEDALNVPLEV